MKIHNFNKSLLVLGALNTVGRYIVNMTRGKDPSMQSSVDPNQNVPNAILTLTKNVLGQNVTNRIEPVIKRIGVVETRDEPEIIVSTTARVPLALTDVDAKKKKKKKNKRKDQLQVVSTSTTRLPEHSIAPAKKEVTYLSQTSTPRE